MIIIDDPKLDFPKDKFGQLNDDIINWINEILERGDQICNDAKLIKLLIDQNKLNIKLFTCYACFCFNPNCEYEKFQTITKFFIANFIFWIYFMKHKTDLELIQNVRN